MINCFSVIAGTAERLRPVLALNEIEMKMMKLLHELLHR
jgi:hypothetical protein